MYKTIIWDWNGTLLNDLDLSIDAVNILLRDRGLPLLSVERYKEIFRFPVIDYYRDAGFDFEKEPFEIPARQYVKLYYGRENETKLFPDVVDTLTYFKNNNFKQYVLSAMENGNLERMVHKAGEEEETLAVIMAAVTSIVGKDKIAGINIYPAQ